MGFGRKNVNRRDFLKYSAFSLASALSLNGVSPQKAKANTGTKKKTFVTIYVPGAYDGTNLFVPYGDPQYYANRPTIGIPEADVLKVNSMHGFNPILTEMHDIYQAGDMAVFPNCHYKNPSRSHFTSKDRISTKFTHVDGRQGWLNEIIEKNNGTALFTSTSTLPLIISGTGPVSTVSSLSNINSQLSDGLLGKVENLADLFDTNTNLGNIFSSHTAGLFSTYAETKNIDFNNYTASNNAQYVSYRGFDKSLQNTADLIKRNLVDTMYVQFPKGFDTHTNQLAAHNDFQYLSKNLKAFYDDLGDQMEDVVVLVFSEFGRTMKENANAGTDHGWANAWFMMGKGINGGVYGDGSSGIISSSNFMQKSIDIEDIFLEILEDHLNLDHTREVFSHHSRTSLGVIS